MGYVKNKEDPEVFLVLLGCLQDLFDLGVAVNDLLLGDGTRTGASDSNDCVDYYDSGDGFEECAHDISFKKSRAHRPTGKSARRGGCEDEFPGGTSSHLRRIQDTQPCITA
jgi:hypothetical protein